ncbi:ribonuclease H-like domain-containing protein [Mycena crocata]|nr:ribonuclease H-like domain-containing protein [Mycena crocata]
MPQPNAIVQGELASVQESVRAADSLSNATEVVLEWPAYPVKSQFRYIANVHEANNALRGIVNAQVGFDTEQTISGSATAAASNGQYGTQHPESHSGDGINWSASKLCIVQVAIPGQVYVLDVKHMRAIPEQLQRILTSKNIPKVGCGVINDTKIINEETGIAVRRFVDVGLMVKLADAEKYSEEDFSGIGLERCVRDVLGYQLDKSNTLTLKWDEADRTRAYDL